MHVEFEFTRDDLIDASQRFVRRGKLANSGMRTIGIYFGLSLGAVVLLFLWGTPTRGLIIGLIVAGILILCYPAIHNRRVQNMLRRIAEETMPEPGPYICEVEVRPAGIWVRQLNKQITYEWAGLDAIEESGDAVNIFTRDGAGVIVRDRAFASDGERAQFVELVRNGLGNRS